MMKNFTFIKHFRAISLIVLFQLIAFGVNAQNIENFENEFGVTFTDNGNIFSLSNNFSVENIVYYGANSSDFYFDSGFGSSYLNQSLGSISIESGKLFNLYSISIWASQDGGNNPSNTPLIFIGKKNGVQVKQETISVEPSAITGGIGGWSTATFSTDWNSTDIDELEIQTTSSTNYAALDDLGYSASIAKTAQTITFNTLSNVTYGDVDFAPGATATSGLTVTYTSSDETIATIVSNAIHIVGAGSCTIYADQAGDEVYDVAAQVSQLLTVSKKELDVYAADKSKLYGEANPLLTITYDGFVGSDDASVIDVEPLLSTAATAASAVQDYLILISGGSDNNYDLSLWQGTLQINKATLTATADDNQKNYGEANPVFTVSYSGFVGDDSASDINTPATATSTATQSSFVGDYDISATGALDDNYDFTYVTGILSINKATLTATADDNQKTYGEANPVFTVSYSGFVGDDSASDINTPATATSTATQSSFVGDYDISATGALDDNYDFTYVTGVLSINKATLTATADDNQKTYGEANPVFTVSYSGFVGDDSASDIDTPATATSTATQSSFVGDYDISATGALDDNYDFTYVTGVLSINKATLTVTADDKVKIQGQENPSFTIAYSGFKNAENESVLDVLPIANCNAIQNSPIGDYPITVSGGEDVNYTFSYVSGNLNVQTATDLNAETIEKVSVWPNPTSGLVHVSNIADNSLFEIYNVSGVMVMKGKLQAGTLNIENLNRGIYVLIVNELKQRIIKQ